MLGKANMEAFSFSACLDPNLHRQAVSVDKLMRDYTLTFDELFEAAVKETVGYVFHDYFFKVTLEKAHPLEKERRKRVLTHMAYQPDVSQYHPACRPLPPGSASCELGEKMLASLKRAAVETGGSRRSGRDRSPAPRAYDVRVLEQPTTAEKQRRRKGDVARVAPAAAKEELRRKNAELDVQLRDSSRLEALSRGRQTQSDAARDRYIQLSADLTQERDALVETTRVQERMVPAQVAELRRKIRLSEEVVEELELSVAESTPNPIIFHF